LSNIVYIAGSFSTIEDIEKVVELQEDLKKAGLEILNQLEPFEWRRLYDFREERNLAKRIVEYDLSLLKKADIVIALADKPSFGVGAEVIYAKRVLGKKVIAIITKVARSPWVLIHADIVVNSFNVKKIIEAIKTFK
jgi:nucleoside 2-deoxyribosyltransferase